MAHARRGDSTCRLLTMDGDLTPLEVAAVGISELHTTLVKAGMPEGAAARLIAEMISAAIERSKNGGQAAR